MNKPCLVAHRGYAAKYPENSMSAFIAAIECGCEYLELDVQLTRDLVPVIIHDTEFTRTGDTNYCVLDENWSSIKSCTVGESDRFGEKFENEKIPSLKDFVELLKINPQVSAFVEIKEECIEKFGEMTVLNAVIEVIEPVRKQCFIISFDANVLFKAKQTTQYPIGFVVHRYDDEHREIAQKLKPDILICNYQKIPDEQGALWDEPWQWFLYEVVDVEIAKKWIKRGVTYIETMEIGSLINALRIK